MDNDELYPDSDLKVDDGFDIDKVAVGPYCLFDNFRPESSSGPSPVAPPSRDIMQDAVATSDYSFDQSYRPNPWMASNVDNPAMPAKSDMFSPQGRWDDWMRWDPALSKGSDATNAQGAMCLRPDQTEAVDARSLSHSLSPQETQALATSGLPATNFNNPAYTFGQSAEGTSAFTFDSTAVGSTPVTDDARNPTFFTDGAPWAPPDQYGSRHDSPMFTETFKQPPSSAISHPDGSSHTTSTPSHRASTSTSPQAISASSHSSPEPVQSNKKKRKASIDDELVESHDPKQPQVKKTAHNMIEKRYRTNLNDKIAALRDSVPSLRVMSRPNGTVEDDDPEDLEGLTPAHKLNKATVLSKATEYIQHLEKRNKRLTDELAAVKGRLDSFESMPMPAPMGMGPPVSTPDGGIRYTQDPFASEMQQNQTAGPPQGMIPIPENMMNLRAARNQQRYQADQNAYPMYHPAQRHQQQQQHPHGPTQMVPRGNGFMSKLMVGSLAGLMVMEGWREHEQSGEEPNGRGLFALPMQLFNIFGSTSSATSFYGLEFNFIALFKMILVVSAAVYVIWPLIESKPKSSKKFNTLTMRLSPAPSLASPVEVRRKAWLTAIQTVWVPRHSFILEAAALGLKMLKLSTRKLIGWEGYSVLTGFTKEQEAARVKAWEIALSAQLTGGDAEISVSRLVLTLMASGTLPDTPARLMLKALHIRVLLWEVANSGYGGWYMFEELSAKLARIYWNAARNEHKMLVNNPNKANGDTEPLPGHLAALIEMECDDVLINNIVLRAYNLAWNRPSAENADADEPMDSVVEDFAISSPLDALAAWWSCHVLSKALIKHLCLKRGHQKQVSENLELAIQTAPPTSGAQLRALVAKSVLIKSDRATNILAACDALPHQSPQSSSSNTDLPSRGLLMNAIGDGPVSLDVRTSLTLAKCLSLADMTASTQEASSRAAAVVNNYNLAFQNFTLLSFTASFEVLSAFTEDDHLFAHTRTGLERLANAMRIWVGREGGRRSGLQGRARGTLVNKCLGFSKTLVGMHDVVDDEDDAGYHTQSDRGSVDGDVQTPVVAKS